jgi:hypothetical protein
VFGVVMAMRLLHDGLERMAGRAYRNSMTVQDASFLQRGSPAENARPFIVDDQRSVALGKLLGGRQVFGVIFFGTFAIVGNHFAVMHFKARVKLVPFVFCTARLVNFRLGGKRGPNNFELIAIFVEFFCLFYALRKLCAPR